MPSLDSASDLGVVVIPDAVPHDVPFLDNKMEHRHRQTDCVVDKQQIDRQFTYGVVPPYCFTFLFRLRC